MDQAERLRQIVQQQSKTSQPDNTEAPKYAKRNILQVLVNRNNQLAINGELADVSTLKDRTIEFVLNLMLISDLPI